MRNERRHAAAAHVPASENGPRADRAEDRLRARLQSRCFVCSQDNPAGLKVRFRQLGDGEAVAA
ncbi:MAG TPA: hypothetical protein PKJ41_15125 [Bryobacteraceae bacterium]|nr:hypothetical protein [Bryobacteraceae bacterium]HPT28498.1 hypothetical protein [Bryobacteraceae bacterium]